MGRFPGAGPGKKGVSDPVLFLRVSKAWLTAASKTASNSERDAQKPNRTVVEIEEPVDEATLIEERRKKREAIKAKFRGTTPLLATALGIKDTPAVSPADSTEVNSPSKPSHTYNISAIPPCFTNLDS